MQKLQIYWKIWKKLSIFPFLNALFFNSCKYGQFFSSSKVTRHIGLKLHQSVRRIGSERSCNMKNSEKRLFLVLKIAFFGSHLFKKGQKWASQIMILIERDVSVSKKFDKFFDLKKSFFAKWILKITIFTQKLGHFWHNQKWYMFMEFFLFWTFFLFF